jgi:hypothetical protein
MSSECSFLFIFSNQNSYKFLILPLRNCYFFGLSHFKLLCYCNSCADRFILLTQSAMQFSPTFCYFFLPSTRVLLGRFFLGGSPLKRAVCHASHAFQMICKIVLPKYWCVRLVALHICVVHVTEITDHLSFAF